LSAARLAQIGAADAAAAGSGGRHGAAKRWAPEAALHQGHGTAAVAAGGTGASAGREAVEATAVAAGRQAAAAA